MRIKFLVVSVLVFVTLSQAKAQSKMADPDQFLIGSRKQPAILLVGAFHFAYYNLDAHKTEKEKQVDILSESKQKEVQELVDHLAQFKPTKIVVEAGRNTGYLMNKYRNYISGKTALGKDEMEQIGFRLMKQFNLDTIYGCNNIPVAWNLYDSRDSVLLRPILDSIYKDWDFTTPESYKLLYQYEDSMKLQLSLLEYFKWRNSDKVQNRSFGYYLTEDFRLGETRGADALSMHWHNRNLRIFRQIQDISTSPDDRILVIFGAGHVDILRYLFECSPEFQLVKFSDLK